MKPPLILVCILFCTVACGCTPAIVADGASSGSTAALTAKSTWLIHGDLQDGKAAVDGNVNTVATASKAVENAKLIIDLGKPCVFNTIILDHGPADEMAFCRRMAVEISYDGRNYTQVYAAPGTRRITYLNLVTPTLARYIRIRVLVPSDRPWSVAEIYLQ